MPELRSKTNKAVIQRVSLTLFFCLVPALVLAAAPKGALKINNDAAYTNTTAVTLNLSATSTGTGLSQMRFSNDNRNWSNPEAYATTKAWVLSSGNGKKTVYVKFKDNANKWSSAYSDKIILDTTAPVTTASGVSDLWKNTNIKVTLKAKDSGSGLYRTYYSSDAKKPPTSVYTGALSFTQEGAYTLRYYSLDKAGNSETPKTANVKIDKTPPTGSIKINNDDQYTNSTAVTLSLQAQDALSGMGAGAQMKFSNNNTQWSNPQAYALTASWKLTSGAGQKTVYVKFKDVAGNWSSAVSDTIILDTMPPTTPTGTIKINNDATYTNSASVILNLSSSNMGGGLDKMSFSNDGITWSAAEVYATTKAWTLATGDGTKTVYAQFKDGAGNILATSSDTIILDTAAPTDGSIVIDSNAAKTTTGNVTLTLSAKDATSDLAQMQFSNDNANWSSWEKYATSKSWTLPGANGTKTVYVRFQDKAGLVSAVYSDTITLDKPLLQTPQITILLPVNKATFIVGETINISVKATNPNNSTLQYCYSMDNAAIKNWSGTASFSVTAQTPGKHTIKFEVRDAKGAAASQTIQIYIFRKFPKPA